MHLCDAVTKTTWCKTMQCPMALQRIAVRYCSPCLIIPLYAPGRDGLIVQPGLHNPEIFLLPAVQSTFASSVNIINISWQVSSASQLSQQPARLPAVTWQSGWLLTELTSQLQQQAQLSKGNAVRDMRYAAPCCLEYE